MRSKLEFMLARLLTIYRFYPSAFKKYLVEALIGWLNWALLIIFMAELKSSSINKVLLKLCFPRWHPYYRHDCCDNCFYFLLEGLVVVNNEEFVMANVCLSEF